MCMMFASSRLPAESIGVLVVTGILLLAPLPVAGQVDAGGLVATDSVWSASAAPYVVTQNVVVVSNAVLTIEPGVEVRFEPDAALGISNGTLVARGTPQDRILFTAAAYPPDAASNRWGYIGFADGAVDVAFSPGGTYIEGCILEHTVVRFGGGTNVSGAIHVEKSHPYLGDNLVESNATGGVYFDNEDSTGGVRLTRNTIRHNSSPGDGGGVCLLSCSGVVVDDNAVCDNTAVGEGGGIYVQECAGAILTNNTVCGNESGQSGGGIAIQVSLEARLIDNTIDGNTGAPGGGIGITSSRAVRLTVNRVLENVSVSSGGGIALTSARDNVLSGNTIVSNRTAAGGVGGAVYAVSSGDLWMSGNIVTHNTAGVDAGSHGGGGLYALFGGTIYLEEDQFLSNVSTGRGGTVCFVQIGGCELSGCVITGNTASAGGGLSFEEVIPGSAPEAVLSSDPLNPTRISGNTLYNVYNGLAYGGPPLPDGPGNVDGRYVWWNATSRSLISPTIYDHSNDGSKGYVVYAPYAVPVTPLPAVVRSLSLSQNQLGLSFTNVVDGSICKIERRLDLLTGNWEAFTNVVASNAPVVYSWIEAETNAAAFYRIQATDWGLAW